MANHAAEGVVRTVRKIKAKLVLRLRAEGFTGRQIAAQGMSRTSVAAVIEAADREGIDWDAVAGMEESAVYARLFPGRGEHESRRDGRTGYHY